MNMIKCGCGHRDEYTAFETSTNGVWKCPICKTKTDTRKNYKDEEFLDTMAKRAGIRDAAEC